MTSLNRVYSIAPSFIVSAPPRHIENGAGHIGGFVRYQPDDGIRDLVCGSDALHRHHVAEPLRTIGFATRGVNVGIDKPGPYRGDTNALAGYFVSEPKSEGIDGTFGGRVVDIG